MLRGFSYSITALIYWVLALCELWVVCTLGNESRCSDCAAKTLDLEVVCTLGNESRCSIHATHSLVYVPLEMRVDAADRGNVP